MEQLNSIFDALAEKVVSALPLSPFQQYISYFENLPFLGWLNWFVPIRAGLVVLGSWLGAIAIFYIYSIALRWVKAIGD